MSDNLFISISFLNKNSKLPMMFMDDAIEATIKIMDTTAEKIKIRSSYNLAAISFTPKEIADEIKTKIPAFKIKYQSDFRQAIADSWPQSIDDSRARLDWNWQHKYDLKKISQTMLDNLLLKYKSE